MLAVHVQRAGQAHRHLRYPHKMLAVALQLVWVKRIVFQVFEFLLCKLLGKPLPGLNGRLGIVVGLGARNAHPAIVAHNGILYFHT